jgi:hypothetical protein
VDPGLRTARLGPFLSAQAFIWLRAACAQPDPISDDMDFRAAATPPTSSASARSSGAPINEHRVPLVRLIVFGLMQLWRDIRGGMFLQVACSRARRWARCCSCAGCADARALGRALPAAVAAPRYAESWLLSLQLTVVLPTVLVLAALALVLWRPARCRGRVWWACARACWRWGPAAASAGARCRPGSWLAWVAWRARRGGEQARPGSPAWAPCRTRVPDRLSDRPALPRALDALEPAKTIAIALEFVCLCAGPAAALKPVPCLLAALALLVATLWGLAQVLRRQPEQAERAAALLAACSVCWVSALGIGLSRLENWPVAGWARVYMGGATPLVLCAVLALVLYGPPTPGRAGAGRPGATPRARLPLNQENRPLRVEDACA